jgi:hypothetical protein
VQAQGDLIDDFLNPDSTQAFIVPDGAFKQHATLAFDLFAEHGMSLTHRVPDPRIITRAEQRDAWNTGHGRQVHSAGIVADVKLASLQHRGRLVY